MFNKITSADKFPRAFAAGILFTIWFLGLSLTVGGEPLPEFEKPFRICRIYENSRELSVRYGSDNNRLVFANKDNFLTSVDPQTNLEDWKSLINGRIAPKIIADKENIFYLASFANESGEETYTLNSISQKTGLANWQIKLGFYTKVTMSETHDENTLYIFAGDGDIQAVRKNDGVFIWKKSFESKIVSIASDGSSLKALTDRAVIGISAQTGEITSARKIEKNPLSSLFTNKTYLMLGYSNGELVKAPLNGSGVERLWKIKAGGGISSIIEVEDEILASSLDNFLYLYSSESGKLKWKRRVSGRINIRPAVFDKYAIVLNSSDNIASIVSLRDGKIVNQLKIEDGNYFSATPAVSGAFIIFQTLKGIYLFANSDRACK